VNVLLGTIAMSNITVRELLPAEIPAAGALLARAMCDNPLHVRVAGADPARREAVFGGIFPVLLASLWARGTVLGAFADCRLVGVCALVPPGCCQPGMKEKLVLLRAVVAQASLGATFTALRWLGSWAKHDPHDRPHWHLGPVGVDRAWQGRGIGRALLREFCARVDAQNGAAYLETDKEVNLAFYGKFNFQTVAQADVIGVPNWFMFRDAAAPVLTDQRQERSEVSG
jgi:ribosomal protein S18 acetylase RimI-like enzyme